MATLGNLLDFINLAYPNSVATTDKINIVNDIQNYIFKYMSSSGVYCFDTVNGQYAYDLTDLGAGFTFDLINDVMVAATTGVPTTDTVFTSYEWAGPEQEMSAGHYYYNALGDLGLYPVPDNAYASRVYYEQRPIQFASSDTATEINLDPDYLGFIKNKAVATVARLGHYPDVDISNNYEQEAQEFERRLKMNRAKEKAKRPDKTWSYTEDWNC